MAKVEVAADRAMALALAAGVRQPGFVRFDIPAGPASLASDLAAHGFVNVGNVQVMVRGRWPTPSGPGLCHGLASQTFG